MKTYTQEELKRILDDHFEWVRSGGVKGRRANLEGANLEGAYLRGANLEGAYLEGAYLRGAYLEVTPQLLSQFSIVPESGSFTAYKKVYDEERKPVVLRLEIPAEAKRMGGLIGRKCRAEWARVIGVETETTETVFYSDRDRHLTYEVGKEVRPDSFCDDPKQECAPGIHFFMTKYEAKAYL